MCPVAPHISEEIWESIGMEGYCSLASWPSYDEKRIDEEAEAGHEIVEQTKTDIIAVLDLIKVKQPKKIKIFIASSWKYDFFKKLKQAMEETRNIGEIMKKVMMDEYKKEITSMVPKLVKDTSKMPKRILSQEKEAEIFAANAEKLKEFFQCELEIIKADASKEQKAKQSMPGKPSLIVE
jgi:leucyl-tRNA synthetase